MRRVHFDAHVCSPLLMTIKPFKDERCNKRSAAGTQRLIHRAMVLTKKNPMGYAP